MFVAHGVQFRGEPTDLSRLFETNAAARAGDRVTRFDRQLRPPAMPTVTGQRVFSYRAAKLLHEIDSGVRRLDPTDFERALLSLAR